MDDLTAAGGLTLEVVEPKNRSWPAQTGS